MYEIIPGAIEDGNLVFNLDNRWMCMYEYHDLFMVYIEKKLLKLNKE